MDSIWSDALTHEDNILLHPSVIDELLSVSTSPVFSFLTGSEEEGEVHIIK